jgi:ribonuclease G
VARAVDNDVLLVMASQVVVDRLLDEESCAVADLQELVAKTLKLEVEPMYTQEQFGVVFSG